MENEGSYTCANCGKVVGHIAKGGSLCETCRANLPTAKFNSRVKKRGY